MTIKPNIRPMSKKVPEMPRYLTPDEYAQFTQVTRKRVYNKIYEGGLVAIKLGGKSLIDLDETVQLADLST